jgi:hypothetical protein
MLSCNSVDFCAIVKVRRIEHTTLKLKIVILRVEVLECKEAEVQYNIFSG